MRSRFRLLRIAAFLSLAACGRPAMEARRDGVAAVVVPTGPRVTPGAVARKKVLGTHADGGSHLSAGPDHVCAVLRTGALKCWGVGNFGQLGLGDKDDRGVERTEMGAALPAVDLGTGRTAVAVSASEEHTCALLATGAIKCWGRGNRGQLGLGDQRDRGDEPNEMGDALPEVDLGGLVR